MNATLFTNGPACDGCGDCVTACAATTGRARVRLAVFDHGTAPVICRHCHDAPCVAACMAGCRSREMATGRVVTDYARCVGCWMCVMACPFGAIQCLHAEAGRPHGTAIKCDGCPGQAVPPCAAACTRGALTAADPLRHARDLRESAARRAVVGTPPGRE